ncbi:MAG: DinB family protein [Alphaproteobacteria bacterium]|nr:DinB family protein [Alphaproteobacteria bacterium]
MTQTLPTAEDRISVYWQTGCTSCLRTKEFLTEHGIAFRSRNVLEDDTALDELARFGLRQVPIVVRGDEWANGQILRDVAKLCGIPWGDDKILPPEELRRRINTIIAATRENALKLPQSEMQTNLPNRPRSYADLVYHTFNIVDAFVEQEEGIPLVYESYYRLPPKEMQTPEGLAGYGDHVAKRFNDWFDSKGKSADWNERVDVYYGEQSRHDFLERTTWHSGQHARQLIWVLERLGIEPAHRFAPDAFRGLPIPEKVWDSEAA